MIAMAMLFTPELVIMDEPTSALDVVAQRSLMVQIKELQREFGFAVIFVTHDMSLISHFSDRLMVMYAGQVAEFGATRQLFDSPLHPYTAGLMDAFPSIRGPRRAADRHSGQPAGPGQSPAGLPVRAALPQGDGHAAAPPSRGCTRWAAPRSAACCTRTAVGWRGATRDEPESERPAQAHDGTVGPGGASARSGDRGDPGGRPPGKHCSAPTS